MHMKDYIYRYISFETLVGMIQSKSLTFVLPELWEDTHEDSAFMQYLDGKDNIFERIMLFAIHNKTYGQCWTQLAESDAMWRIYSYNNRAIRVKVSEDKIHLLNNVHMVPVKYTDDPFVPIGDNLQDYLLSISQKRVAFQHENEIRLINYYKFSRDEDCENHIKAFLAISEHHQAVEIIESLFPRLSIDEQVLKICEMLNMGNQRDVTKNISYAHMPNFIDGIMIHPQAPDWYVKIVEDFCTINSIPFEGKSKLYSH